MVRWHNLDKWRKWNKQSYVVIFGGWNGVEIDMMLCFGFFDENSADNTPVFQL